MPFDSRARAGGLLLLLERLPLQVQQQIVQGGRAEFVRVASRDNQAQLSRDELSAVYSKLARHIRRLRTH